ncbi:MAG: glycosyltransferase family 2 protein [Candidatus Sumerlaeia bacterium]|nr:glycosyltransferase family 2 protein [Candidatus Sumerlaeia bacterium]
MANMSPREKLSVLVPTFNEEHNIRACLESVRWADEVVVVDSFSTDRTRDIAREIADRVLEHEYINSATQKNWAIPQMSHPWVLIVDSDERVTPALRDEILAVLENPGGLDGFRIGRINHFLGKRVRFCGWQHDCVLRLFRRDLGRYQDREVHADVIIESGRVGRLQNKLLHYTFDSFEQYLKKFDRYTSWAAGDRGRLTRRVRWHHLALRPAWRFVRQYVFQLGFLDGLTGLVLCSLAAYSVFLKYAKLWERQEREARGER